ncbi:MAG: DNA-binding response regulator [Verrucomicrobia bacterium]|nr:MAG: DNA-binding response regulator [Verrucomicrobiota bacterium]
MTVPPSPTVFVVDDEAPVRRALSRMLRANRFAVATFASSKEFLGQYDPDASGCLVLDIMMPGNGLELQRVLQKKGCTLPIIFLTGYGDVSKSVQALKGGAIDFLTKPVNDQSLLRAVRAAIGKNRVTRQEQTQVSEICSRLAALTPRERQVLEHIVSGELNKQIAGHLGITQRTVKAHRARLMEKMKVDSVAKLVCLANRCGITGSSS